MSIQLGPCVLATAAMAAALTFTSPAAANTGNTKAALLAAAPIDGALSDEDLAGLRGAAGLLGLPSGSSTFVQIGATTDSQFQPGSPSSASSSLSLDGSSLSASASLGPSNGVPGFSLSQTFGQTVSVSSSQTFNFSYSLGL